MNEKIKKLKPVVFVQGRYAYNNKNTTQQIMLLSALKITQDPKKLKELLGVKTVAEVYRTLDKIAMRKEYHSALAKSGITFEYVVDRIKDLIEGAEKDSVKLDGLKVILKSIGLDKYEETAIGGGNWEEALIKINEEKKEETKEEKESTLIKYEVIEPKIPEHIRKAKAKSLEESKGLYE